MREVRTMLTSSFLPGTGRGTMRSMVEGQVGIGCGGLGETETGIAATSACNFNLPLHQLRWSPSPVRGGSLS
jgi:hypothetical protein